MDSGFMALSIYCAEMASKWGYVLDSQPTQGKDMSVQVYYDQFFHWKKKLEEVNYIGGEESYIDDFLYGLKMDLAVRVWGYKWKPRTLYGAFRRAEIEETMLSKMNDVDKVFEDMSQPNSIDIADTIEAEGVPDEKSNGVGKLDSEEETESEITSEQDDSGPGDLENEDEDDFLHLKADNPLVEMVRQSFPSKPEVIEDANHMFDEMLRPIPVSLNSDASLFRDEGNDNLSSNIKGLQTGWQLFDVMPKRISGELNEEMYAIQGYTSPFGYVRQIFDTWSSFLNDDGVILSFDPGGSYLFCKGRDPFDFNREEQEFDKFLEISFASELTVKNILNIIRGYQYEPILPSAAQDFCLWFGEHNVGPDCGIDEKGKDFAKLMMKFIQTPSQFVHVERMAVLGLMVMDTTIWPTAERLHGTSCGWCIFYNVAGSIEMIGILDDEGYSQVAVCKIKNPTMMGLEMSRRVFEPNLIVCRLILNWVDHACCWRLFGDFLIRLGTTSTLPQGVHHTGNELGGPNQMKLVLKLSTILYTRVYATTNFGFLLLVDYILGATLAIFGAIIGVTHINSFDDIVVRYGRAQELTSKLLIFLFPPWNLHTIDMNELYACWVRFCWVRILRYISKLTFSGRLLGFNRLIFDHGEYRRNNKALITFSMMMRLGRWGQVEALLCKNAIMGAACLGYNAILYDILIKYLGRLGGLEFFINCFKEGAGKEASHDRQNYNTLVDDFGKSGNIEVTFMVLEVLNTDVGWQSLTSKYTIGANLDNFIWDPGLCAIFVYILEDKDVLKRKGIGVRLSLKQIGVRLALKQDEGVNGAHMEFLACSLFDRDSLLFLIILPLFQHRELYDFIGSFVTFGSSFHTLFDYVCTRINHDHSSANQPSWLGSRGLDFDDAIDVNNLINACTVHNDTNMGKEIVNKLSDQSLDHDGAYLLLSNMYAAVNNWNNVQSVKKGMEEMKLKKVPGCSLIDVNGVLMRLVYFAVAVGMMNFVVAMLEHFVWDPGLVGFDFTTLRTRRLLRGRICHVPMLKFRKKTAGALVVVK